MGNKDIVYISRFNSRKISKNIDFRKMEQLKGELYDKPIFLFNKRERQTLLAYKMLMEGSPKLPVDVFIPFVSDLEEFVYNDRFAPSYHLYPDCEKLHGVFRNYRIPQAIRQMGFNYVEWYRNWFKDNIERVKKDPDSVLEDIQRIYGAKILLGDIMEISLKNSGSVSMENWDLSTLKETIDAKLHEAGCYYYQSDKHTKILKKYCYQTYLWKNNLLGNNDTGYSDEEVLRILMYYDENFKTPIYNMLFDYYRVKLNPELSMDGLLLKKLGFRECLECQYRQNADFWK